MTSGWLLSPFGFDRKLVGNGKARTITNAIPIPYSADVIQAFKGPDIFRFQYPPLTMLEDVIASYKGYRQTLMKPKREKFEEMIVAVKGYARRRRDQS
jgi:hypothetical protein